MTLPISGAKDYHKGIDIAVPTGTDIMAGQDGRVTAAAFDSGGYGWYVVIEDDKAGSPGGSLVSKYAHCDSLLVSVGQEVKKGDVIAKSGNSGNSTGPHLHLEVIKNGRYLNPIYFAETGDDGSGRIPPRKSRRRGLSRISRRADGRRRLRGAHGGSAKAPWQALCIRSERA